MSVAQLKQRLGELADLQHAEAIADWDSRVSMPPEGAEARALMRRNRSYIFFREAPELPAGAGPIGGAGIPLVAGRSLAVDRALWSRGSRGSSTTGSSPTKSATCSPSSTASMTRRTRRSSA